MLSSSSDTVQKFDQLSKKNRFVFYMTLGVSKLLGAGKRKDLG